VAIWAPDQVVRGDIWPLCSIAIRSAFNSKALITLDKVDGDVRVSRMRCWPFSWIVRGFDILVQASRLGLFGAPVYDLALFWATKGRVQPAFYWPNLSFFRLKDKLP